jgi:aminoglycoside phosphotransferase (APT) family kinase protein
VGRVDETGHAQGTSSRFAISFDPGPPPTVTKRGDRDALSREAQALVALAGHDWLPALIHHETGRLVTEWLPGSPRPLSAMASADGRALGTTLRAVHRSVPGSDLCSTPGGYARSRVEAVRRAARRADMEHEILVPASARTLMPIHGDLVEANIIWGPNGPALIDWEFWRQGDPAEDLAYLITLNDLPRRVIDDVTSGYDTDEPWARVAAWRPIVTLEAAAWYRLAGDTDRADALLRG